VRAFEACRHLEQLVDRRPGSRHDVLPRPTPRLRAQRIPSAAAV